MDYNKIPFKNRDIDKIMGSDTTKTTAKMDTLVNLKRTVGNMDSVKNKAEKLGLKSPMDLLKQRIADKKKN